MRYIYKSRIGFEKMKLRKSVDRFCRARIREGLPCRDCPAMNSKLCYSTEYWNRESLKSIRNEMERLGIDYNRQQDMD